MKRLKKLILDSLKNIDFKYLEIREPNEKILNLIWKEIKLLRKNNYNFSISGIEEKDLGNFIFILRILDFRLWEFP
ncbi:MAG: hypothetical protein ACP5JU_01220, partial [Minisyncoccia bacterium]